MNNLEIFGLSIVIILIAGLTLALYKQYRQGRKELLEEMFYKNDISSDVYKKYIKNI